MKSVHVKRMFFWGVLCIASTCMVSEAMAQTLRPIAKQIIAAKQSVDFQLVAPFLVTQERPVAAGDISKSLKNATFAVLPDVEIRRLYARNLAAMRLLIPFQNQILTVDVVQVEALSDDFNLTDPLGQPLPFKAGRFYRGTVLNDVNTVVSVNLFENEINGILSTPEHGNINFGKWTFANNVQDYIIYSDQDWLTPFTFQCGTQTPKDYDQTMQSALNAAVIPVNEAKCVRLGWEVTNPLHIALGNNLTTTVNYITSAYNNAATLYANDGIRTNLAQLIVWQTADNYTTNNTSTTLTEFRTRRISGLSGNLFHLIAPLPSTGGGGIAYVDVLCNTNYRYAYSQIRTTASTVPTYSWTVEVLTHETGHNLGSPHTQSCSWPVTPTWTGGALDNCYAVEGSCSAGPAPTNGGTIMSYCHLIATGINFNNGFGTEPGNLIRARVAAAGCLTACGSVVTCCGTPSIFTETIAATTTTISWTAVVGATGYNFRYRIGSTGVWNNYPLTTNSIVLNPLTAATTYQYEVQSICSNGSTDCAYSATRSFTTTGVSTCCGTVTGLSISNLNPSMVTLNWAATAGVTNYEVQLKTSAMTTWWTFTSTGTAFLIYGLTPNTAYQWQVRPICTNGLICWSSGSNFTTPAACVDANEANNTKNAARTMTLGTVYKGTIPSADNDWFKFTIPTANTLFTVSLKNLANNFRLHLYSSNGTTLLATSNNAGLTNESISRTNTVANTVYYALVRSSTNSTFDGATCYELRAAIGAALEAEMVVENVVQVPTSVATSLQNIDNQGDTKIELFPNPTNGVIQLQISGVTTPNLIPMVEITDMLGRKWQQKELSEVLLNQEPYLLDLNGYQDGLYLVRVQLGNQVTTHKIRLQR